MNNADRQKKRLRWILIAFFLTLSLPVYYLLQTVYSQLENEAYFTARHQAETLVDHIELNLKNLLETEQNRPIAEYQFFNVMANPLLSESQGVKFSPLSEMPPKTEIKGLIGYFQINTDGSFHLPVLPEVGQDNLSGLSLAELESRVQLKKKIRTLLSIKKADKKLVKQDIFNEVEIENTKVATGAKNQPYIEEFKQQSFPMADEIASSGEKLKLKKQASIDRDENIFSSTIISKRMRSQSVQKYSTRKETVQLPDQAMASSYFNRGRQSNLAEREDQPLVSSEQASSSIIKVLSFESEVTPLQLLLIGQDYFCFYRYVWHDNNRYTQGFIVKVDAFLEAVTYPLVNASPFSSLVFSKNRDGLQKININASEQEFELYKRQLAMPFQKMELFVNATKLINVPGSLLIDLLALSLFCIFFIGFIAFYRLGSKQIDLAKQQQDFISAVSHELKTPLTSIRMYGEMLRSGWVADDAKKQTYYDYIFFESERLSRLIANVLQFARLGQKQTPEIITITAQQLLDQIASKIEAQIESSCFKLNIIQPIGIANPVDIKVDEDAFFQIIINLVDNAIKFSSKAKLKQIDIGFGIAKNHRQITFFIRDYGPGIKKSQLKKIFTLFYRPENELTRTTTGTGIGLALVAQLAESMQAKITVINKKLGAEFQVTLPVVYISTSIKVACNN
jgi:signal transduction histidine kinase